MIDLKLVRENPAKVREALLKRGEDVDLNILLGLDKERRETLTEVEGLKSRRNQVSAEISGLRAENRLADVLIEEMKDVSSRIKALDLKVAEIENQIAAIIDELPNLPDEDVPPGGKENNEVIRTWGHKPDFDFSILDHVELAEKLGLVDYNRGVKLGGANFWLYKGVGALIEWGFLNYFVESHVQDGYEFILPPHILRYECGYAAGQFPKFAEDVFHIFRKDNRQEGQFLLPTAETALINLHRDEILDEAELPKKYFSFTPCYRKEVGSYRATERGTMRGHQFNKVEMFQFTIPEMSDKAHIELLEKAEKLVRGLGLHYQVTKLAAQDMSGAMAKTFDVEIWIPSLGRYTEVSSVSNARDYQARRGKIRFRRSHNRKTEFVHTLNASGLATSRLIVGLIEQLQQADGSLVIPEVLRKWVGKEVIYPISGPIY
ncbi:MAG TPA: serine--tRNA ligase [Anaerolineales bacterium]|nr:serine--tRNA ligase [Anaerolineales bacterium]